MSPKPSPISSKLSKKFKRRRQRTKNANTNEDKLSSPAKTAIRVGAIGLVLAITYLVYQAIKNQKVKK